MVGLIVKILWKIYKTPLILFHAACLKTRFTGVRPAVDLIRKALLLNMAQNIENVDFRTFCTVTSQQ